MANHKSAEKAHRQGLKKNLLNKSRLNRVKTYVKRAIEAIESNEDSVLISKSFRDAQSEIAKSVKAGCMKANAASRKISSFARKLKSTIVG